MSFFKLRHPIESPASEVYPAEVREAWAQYQFLERSQWLSTTEIVEMQLEKVRALLEHCQQAVPFYAKLLRDSQIVPQEIRTLEDFRRIPIISRRVWQEHAAELQAQHLPAGHWLTAKSTTSGTTGVPLTVYQTNVVHRWWWACNLRDLQWGGIDPRGTLAGIRPPVRPFGPAELLQYQHGISYPNWFPGLQGLIESGKCYGIDIQPDPPQQLKWLQSVSPDYLLSYASHLEILGNLLQQQQVRLPNLKAIQTIGETLTPDVQARIEAAFGVPVKDLYTCAEAGYVASPCPDGHGYHVQAEHVLLEVLNEADEPCAPGETGRLVLTALHNYLNPFIRYEIQDEATAGVAACPCGRGLPLLQRIHGKARPLFQLPDGRLKNSCNMVFGFYNMRGYRQHQIIQRTRDRVTVRIVPDDSWTDQHPDRIRKHIDEFFEHPMATEVEVVEKIERPPGGKVLDFVCELPPLHTARQPEGQPRNSGDAVATPANRVPSAFRGRTVLFAWELGAGMGHVQQLLPLAKALTAHGLRAVFAVREPEFTGALLQSQGFEVLQAPNRHVADTSAPTGLAASFADILARCGFNSVEQLSPLLQAWQDLLDQVQPDLIVCDHSPTLCLASAGAIPTVLVGSGFTVPPITEPVFPVLIPGQELYIREERMLAVVQEVQRQRGRLIPQTLPGIFSDADCFVTAVPELDPYQAERKEPVVGPLDRLGAPIPPPPTPSYFAYLNAAQAGVEQVLNGLLSCGFPGQVYLRQLTEAQRDLWKSAGVNIIEQMPPIREVLARATVVVHHGGAGTAQHALAIGRPQLLLPTQLEQILSAQLLQQLGVARYIIPMTDHNVIASALRQLLMAPNFSAQAWAKACELHGRGLGDALSRVLAHCFLLLNKTDSTQTVRTHNFR